MNFRNQIICLILLVLLPSKAPAKQTATAETLSMFEPIFGISYQPDEVRFPPAPKDVFTCRGLKKPPRKLFLFGSATKDNSRFYYVYGLIQVDSGRGSAKAGGAFEAESDDGIIVVLSPKGCRNIGAGYALSPDPQERDEAAKVGVTSDVVAALLQDAVDREVEAFGGTAVFLAKLKAARVDESTLHPSLREKLSTIRRGREQSHEGGKGQ